MKSRKRPLRAALALTLIFLLLTGLFGCASQPEEGTAESSSTQEMAAETQVPEPTYNPEFVIEPPALLIDGLDGEEADDEAEEPESSPAVVPVSAPDVPECAPHDNDYYADAAFVGNSLVDGFRLFSGLQTCDYYAATSMTVLGVYDSYVITLDSGAAGTIMQGLAQKPYGKVFILLGINEIGYEPDYFKELYANMLADMMASQPEADFYIMGLSPVSYYKSTTSNFTLEKVHAYNEVLYDLAEETGCYYLDLCEALAGEDGYLPSDATSDGIHFTADLYLVWLDYIRTHTV